MGQPDALAARLPAIGGAGRWTTSSGSTTSCSGSSRRSRLRAASARSSSWCASMRAPIRRRRAPPTTRCSRCSGRSPVVILVVIAVPSFRLLFCSSRFRRPTSPSRRPASSGTGPTAYPDNGKFEFDSAAWSLTKELKPDQPRLLAVDNQMVVPVNKVVRVLVTGADVIHCLRGAVVRHQDRRRSRAGSTRPGSRRRARASITASARSCAARTTPSCRSRCGW